MTRVMAVEFRPHGLLHYLDPGTRSYRVGDTVLFPTDNGPEVCRVVWAPESCDAEGFDALPVCRGPAGDDDLRRDERNIRIRAEALAVTRLLVERHGLAMKLVGVDFIDRSDDFDQLVILYYTAPVRVDFRALLTDLARSLQSRIDLRQVGSRDATRIAGGVGECGRDLCCSTFLDSFEPISMRLAKLQGLPNNPLQLSGVCGRLKCCLRYEQAMYAEFSNRAPEVGARISTPGGEGVVVAHAVALGAVTVRDDHGELSACPLESVCPLAGRPGPAPRTVRRRRYEARPGESDGAESAPGEGAPRPGPRLIPRPRRPCVAEAGEPRPDVR